MPRSLFITAVKNTKKLISQKTTDFGGAKNEYPKRELEQEFCADSAPF